MVKPHADISDPRLVKALAHPLRVRILSVLDERTASPTEIADELGAPLGNVSYHVRKLASLGLIKLVKKTPRRGAIEHHYRANARSQITDRAWAEVPGVVKEAMVSAVLGEIASDIGAAGEVGFGRPDSHLTRAPLVLDGRGWKTLAAELEKLVARADRIEEESKERLVKSDGDGERRATLVSMLFESPAVPAAERAPARASRRARRKAAVLA
jgi:DNA-binding transcriptional ArsR family regulator